MQLCQVAGYKSFFFGVSNGKAYSWSPSGMGGWAIAQSPMIITTVTIERLIRKGFRSFSEQFQKSCRSASNEIHLGISFVW
ncbi:MAG: hypothetical protein K8S16_04220 [Bacteroidales bacterium]|nr:hypothetical protein [Bacteroidales bacterium]